MSRDAGRPRQCRGRRQAMVASPSPLTLSVSEGPAGTVVAITPEGCGWLFTGLASA